MEPEIKKALNFSETSVLQPEEIKAFETEPQFLSLRGPRSLFRFGDPRGAWWFGDDLLDEIREDFLESRYGHGPRAAVGYNNILLGPRDSLAVSNEWNSFNWLCRLRVPAGDTLDCWTGKAARQPAWQSKQAGSMLRGGTQQYLIRNTAKLENGLVEKVPVQHVWRLWSKNPNAFR